MIRKQIHITEQQDKKLKTISAQTGLKQSELFRRALDNFINDNNLDITLMSEASLAKDWMRAEEDEYVKKQ